MRYAKTYVIHRLDGRVVRSPVLPRAYEVVCREHTRFAGGEFCKLMPGDIVEHEVTRCARRR